MIERLYKYTQKVRGQVLKRDNFASQLRKYTEEKGWFRHGGYCRRPENCDWLQVHHITPQRMGGSSQMENMITLTECQHIGRCPGCRILPEHRNDIGKRGKWLSRKEFMVHPDMQEALMGYNPSRNSFKEVFAKRDKQALRNEIYWDNSHDDEMRETAIRRSKEIANIRRQNGK